MNDSRTIRVTGKGQLRVRPDMTRITITLEGIDKQYNQTLHHAAAAINELCDRMAPLGFQRADIKTVRFSIDTEYESRKDHGQYTQHFIGYSFTHVVKLEFDSDNKRLGNVLYGLANSPLHPHFTLSYFVKDVEAVKNTLLGKAVTDAKEKALTLTTAAGVTLGKMVTIDYSWRTVEWEVHPLQKDLCYEATTVEGSLDIDIEPDDINTSDTVTIVWEIS